MFGKCIIKRIFTCLLILSLMLGMLPSTVQAEGEVVVNTDMSLSVDVYDKLPDSSDATLLTSLVPDGSTTKADIGAWAYTDTRYLKISATDIPIDKQYELVVTMQPIIKAMSTPDVAGTTKSFTRNTFPVNTNGTFSAEDYSGTIVWTINKGTESIAFALELGYDITLWNKLEGELNSDVSQPLVSVYLREVGTDTQINTLNLHKAHAPETFSETISAYAGDQNVKTWYKTDTVGFTVNRMVNAGYNDGFYYPKLEIVIEVPRYTHTDGNTYYLDIDYSALKFNCGSGTANYTAEYNEDTHVLTLTLVDYYTMNNNHFSGINFSLSEEVAKQIENPNASAFAGKVSMTQYQNSQDDSTGIAMPISSSGKFSVSYITMNNSIVKRYPSSASTITPNAGYPDAVNYLGTFALLNQGAGESTPYWVELIFDTKNTNAIHATTIHIMPDFVSEYIEIHYTMINDAGEVVVSDGVYQLKNTWCGKNPATVSQSSLYEELRRSMLKPEHQGYYFKSVSYKIAKIPGQITYYRSSGNRSYNCGGTLWGYVVGDAGTTTTIQANVYDLSNIDGQEQKTLNSKLSQTLNINLKKTLQSSFYLDNVTIANLENSNAEVQAGNDFQIKGAVVVTPYPYGDTGILKDVRIGLQLPQGVTLTAEDVTASTNKDIKITDIVVNPPTDTQPLWIIELNKENLKLGYYNEILGALPEGVKLSFTIKLHTERSMSEQTIQLINTIWATGKEQNDAVGGTYKSFCVNDVYDLNSSGTLDKIAGINTAQNKEFTIKAAPALLDITAGVRNSTESISDSDAALKHFADIITYDLKIACTDGGRSQDFFYLIPIPKVDSPVDPNFVYMSRVNLNLKGQPAITHSGGTAFELLYTTADADTLSYEFASVDDNVYWLTANQVSDWTKVTMIKVVPASDTIETGTLSVISVPLVYAGNNYEYAYDATTYAQDAGKTIQFSSRGYYNHQKGIQVYAGTSSTAMSIVRLEYTVPVEQKITLTAAKEGNLGEDDSITGSVVIKTLFDLPQDYEVRMVDPSNVTLVPSGSDFSELNCNTNFGITVKVNGGTEKDLDESASVEEPIKLGTVAEKTEATFDFTIYNGDALSDTTTPKTVKLDIIGHNGVTIPVEITIKVIATPVDNATVAIIDHKEYVPFTGSNEVHISKDSALTAQFVANNLVPNNYPSRVLSFNSTPAEGTTILMIDWTDRANPEYYYHKLDGETTSIPLTSFANMANGNHYVNPSGETPIAEETLLFVVDFADAAEPSTEIILTREGNQENQISDLVQKLAYTVSETRSFDLITSATQVEPEDSITITYKNTAPNNCTDNYFANRKMALVLSADTGNTLPVDTTLVVGDESYSQNQNGQFIVPLGNVVASGTSTSTITMELVSKGVVQSCSLNAELWVSATANDLAPIAGELVGSKTFTLIPQELPSFKVVQMSNRKFIYGEDSLEALIGYESLDLEGCTVYLEVQQKKSETGYAADAYYISTLNGVQASMKNDISDIVTSEGELKLVFKNEMPIGTYRLLFTVEKENQEVLSVPYNFMVLK